MTDLSPLHFPIVIVKILSEDSKNKRGDNMDVEDLENQSINDYNYLKLLKKFYDSYLKDYKLKFFSVQFLHVLITGLTLIPPLILREIIDEAIPAGNISRIITQFP